MSEINLTKNIISSDIITLSNTVASIEETKTSINPHIARIINAANKYFREYNEEDDNEEEDDMEGLDRFVYTTSSTNIFSIKNKGDVILKKIIIEKFESEQSEEEEYIISLILESPNIYRCRNYNTLSRSGVLEKNLYSVLTKLLNKFQTITKCSECLDLNLTSDDICLDCSLRIFLNYSMVECAICMESTCSYITLPCDHKFHAICFSKVKCCYYQGEHGQKCPLCRALIITEKEYSNTIFRKIS